MAGSSKGISKGNTQRIGPISSVLCPEWFTIPIKAYTFMAPVYYDNNEWGNKMKPSDFQKRGLILWMSISFQPNHFISP